MRIILAALLLMAPSFVKADVYSMEVNAATSAVDATFSTASTSKKDFSSIVRKVRAVCLDNGTAVTLVMACNGSATAPTDADTVGTATRRLIVRSGKAQCMDDGFVGNICYLKGRSAASTGTYVMTVSGS